MNASIMILLSDWYCPCIILKQNEKSCAEAPVFCKNMVHKKVVLDCSKSHESSKLDFVDLGKPIVIGIFKHGASANKVYYMYCLLIFNSLFSVIY